MNTALRVAFALFCVPAQAAVPTPAPLSIDPEPAPRAVGFRVQLVGERPVQVGCWYPAVADSGTPLTYADYLAHSGAEQGGEAPRGEARQALLHSYRALLASNGVPEAAVDEWLGRPVRARAEATPAPGPWPLVLVAQGYFHSLHHQALLAELLAGRGAVVCSTPSQARRLGPMASEADVFPHADAQAADLVVAEQFARREWGGSGAVELVGHSFGARSALLFAARHGARALVSLDGGIGAAEAREWVKQAPEIAAERLRLPILHVYEEGDPALTPDFRLLEGLVEAPRTLLRVEGLRHVHFTSYGVAAAAIPALEPEPTAQLALHLRAALHAAAAFLDSSRAGAPAVPPPAADSGFHLRVWPAR